MTGADGLRPNEVAGTWNVDAINTVMRESLGDDWADMLITRDTGREIRPMLWSDFLPPQDAPALGYYTDPLIGAEVIPDMIPPKVTTPDPVADLVKAYKLIRDTPHRRDAGDPRWHRFTALSFVDTVDADYVLLQQQMQTAMQQAAAEAMRKLGEAADTAQRAGCALCVHDGPSARTGDRAGFDDERATFTVTIRAHMLRPGEMCAHLPRTQYGDTT